MRFQFLLGSPISTFSGPRKCGSMFVGRYSSVGDLAAKPSAESIFLPHRKIISLQGADTLKFLQGLITNDVNTLSSSNPLIYTGFLQHKGRLLCDALMYASKNLQEFEEN
eukprot:Sdes_comp24548_c0_seq1m22416